MFEPLSYKVRKFLEDNNITSTAINPDVVTWCRGYMASSPIDYRMLHGMTYKDPLDTIIYLAEIDEEFFYKRLRRNIVFNILVASLYLLACLLTGEIFILAGTIIYLIPLVKSVPNYRFYKKLKQENIYD